MRLFWALGRDLYKVSAIDLPHARRLAYRVVLGQAGVTVTAALCAWAFGPRGGASGQVAGLSALLGGGIATLGSLVMAVVMFAGKAVSAGKVLGALYFGEALKLAVVVALFVWVLRMVRVAPLAMFAAFGATLLVYWIALVCALPRVAFARSG
ncbi:MAG: ATP synthase subunit I [Gammaproteobacteria bacterium]|nr:ATP synthase subunit I [Gammaproteobacteria bacterium]